jgi:hypothetical protein
MQVGDQKLYEFNPDNLNISLIYRIFRLIFLNSVEQKTKMHISLQDL